MENTNITPTKSLLADIDSTTRRIQYRYWKPEGREALTKDITLWSDDEAVDERLAQAEEDADKDMAATEIWIDHVRKTVTAALSYGHEWWALRENAFFWYNQGQAFFGESIDFVQAADASVVTGQVYRTILRLKDIFENVERKYKASSADTASQQPAQDGKPAQPTTVDGCEFKPIKPFNAEGLHRFLLNEKIITVNYSTFLACLKSADFSEVYKDCKKAKLKCAIRELRYSYESLWFDMVCQYLGSTKADMSKFNLNGKENLQRFQDNMRKAMRV